MVRQIPKRLLIHNVKYAEYNGTAGGWGGTSGSYKPAIDYKRVRVEPSTKLYTDSTGNSVTAKAVMFIDAVNSDYNNILPKEKSKVTFEGIEFVVGSVDYLYVRTLHHLEVYLV